MLAFQPRFPYAPHLMAWSCPLTSLCRSTCAWLREKNGKPYNRGWRERCRPVHTPVDVPVAVEEPVLVDDDVDVEDPDEVDVPVAVEERVADDVPDAVMEDEEVDVRDDDAVRVAEDDEVGVVDGFI